MLDLETVQLKDHTWILSGFPFPSELFSDKEGVPLIRIRTLLNDSIDTFFNGTYSDDYIVENGDVLVGMDGDFNVVRWNKGRALLNQRVCKVLSTSDQLDQGYLFWLLEPELTRIHRRTPQTTVRHLSVKDLNNIAVEVPPAFEQRLIAHMLDTVDTQIRRTEELIAKLEQVKQGLLTDLLTRGVDENGELRPPPTEAPHLYKDSLMGLIPNSWTPVRLGDHIQSHNAGIYIPKDEYGSGKPIIGVSDLYSMDILENQSLRLAPLSESRHKRHHILEEGDIVYGESSLVLEGIAKTVAVGSKGSGSAFEWHTRRIRINRNVLNPFFTSIQLSYSPLIRRRIMSVATQTALTGMTTEGFFSVSVLAPPLHEQELCVERFHNLSNRINKEKLMLDKLNKNKRGLMDDLLTGRVRVTPLLGESEPAAG